jgi:WD40 repeat protein
MSDPHQPKPAGQPLIGPVGYIYSLAFRPKNRTLATASTDRTVWLWNLTNPTLPEHLATLTGAEEALLTVTFNPANDILAAGGHDRSVRLWNTDPDTAARWICAVAGDPMTLEEWSQYVTELQFSPPCPKP